MSRLWILLVWFGCLSVMAGIVVIAAGRADLPMVWGVLGVVAVFVVASVAQVDSALWRERFRPAGGNRDRLTRPIAFVLLLSHWILVGLDVGRHQWSPIPWPVQVAGLVGYAVAMAGVFWAMRVNPFYSSAVRIQTDRGQRPITAGPYRLVRHPGYTASVLGMICSGLALGSWVAMLPILGLVVLFVRRTLVEDRMLRADLPGYTDYANRVRYRLVAGVF